MSYELPTTPSIFRTGYLVHVRCKACRHTKGTDLAALVDAGAGDMPWVKMKWRCDNCGARLTDFVLAGSHMRPSSHLCQLSRCHMGHRYGEALPSADNRWRDMVMRRRHSVGRRALGDATMRRDELRYHSFHVFGADM